MGQRTDLMALLGIRLPAGLGRPGCAAGAEDAGRRAELEVGRGRARGDGRAVLIVASLRRGAVLYSGDDA
jgi:hypothetical protein